ncbi:MAG: lysophospholipid acyltransferase family protein [Anaerolineales bacterium]|jgi:1-acyl-sn-glycerol-3-phosphate acyltransferase
MVDKTNTTPRYKHEDWHFRRQFCRFLLRTIAFPWLIRLEKVVGLENIPEQDAVVLLINHIAFVDPIVMVHTVPRNIVPLAKIEVYQYPIVGIFPRIWGVIPVQRQGVDRKAIQKALDVLRAGEIVLVAPEGTRNSALQRGREGVAYLASRANAAVVPVAIEGTQGYPTVPFSEYWRKQGVSVRFGKPFRFISELKRARGDQLRKMTDEAMYRVAILLPEKLRGVYSDLSKATQETIEWVN